MQILGALKKALKKKKTRQQNFLKGVWEFYLDHDWSANPLLKYPPQN